MPLTMVAQATSEAQSRDALPSSSANKSAPMPRCRAAEGAWRKLRAWVGETADTTGRWPAARGCSYILDLEYHDQSVFTINLFDLETVHG